MIEIVGITMEILGKVGGKIKERVISKATELLYQKICQETSEILIRQGKPEAATLISADKNISKNDLVVIENALNSVQMEAFTNNFKQLLEEMKAELEKQSGDVRINISGDVGFQNCSIQTTSFVGMTKNMK